MKHYDENECIQQQTKAFRMALLANTCALPLQKKNPIWIPAYPLLFLLMAGPLTIGSHWLGFCPMTIMWQHNMFLGEPLNNPTHVHTSYFITIDPLHAFNINIATVAISHVGEPRPNYCERKNCIMAGLAAALLFIDRWQGFERQIPYSGKFLKVQIFEKNWNGL